MRIVVAGAGSIGCFVGGLLAAAGRDVAFLARHRIRDELAGHGLSVTDCDGGAWRLEPSRLSLHVEPSILAGADLVLVTVKSGATEEMGGLIATHCRPGTRVVSLQNGIGNADRLAAVAPAQHIVAGMVPFNVLHRGEGRFHRGTDGALTIASGYRDILQALAVPGLALAEHPDMPSLAWGKLLMNLNNALNALSGLPLIQQLGDRRWRRVLAACQHEALAALAQAGIEPARVGKVRPALLPRILVLPDPAFRLLARAMLKIDPQARSSMWEDLEKHRPTEIGHLQGAVVDLARASCLAVPVNERVTAAIRAAEAAGQGSPRLSPNALLG